MEFVQKTQNIWGEEMVVRASWWLLYATIAVALGFLVVHFALRFRWIGKGAKAAEGPGSQDKIKRHSLASRLFHWVMAGSMLVLLVTGFLPVMGISFSWMTPHWVAGVVLIASVAFHVVHVLVRRSLLLLWVSPRDVGDWFRGLAQAFGAKSPPIKAGKYPVENKLFHHAAVVTSAGVIVTGVMMMMMIDTPFFTANPELVNDSQRGLVFVIHGFTGIALVGLIITHVYFAILPEKRWITKSMINGWITRGNFDAHHDPERWKPEDQPDTPQPTAPASGSEAPAPDQP